MSDSLFSGSVLDQTARRAVFDRVAPGIALGALRRDGSMRCAYAGRHGLEPSMPAVDDTSLFDLASLTKPLATWLWAALLLESGALALEVPVGRYVEVFDPRLSACPVAHLLSHTSGLPAHREFFRGLLPHVRASLDFSGARRTVNRMLRQTELEHAPGLGEVYSDLGFLLLEQVCAAAGGQELGTRWPTLPFHGVDGAALHFRPLPAVVPELGPDPRYVQTEACPLRGRIVRGEVHDENAWTMGGVAGHAGLFGSLPWVLRFGEAVARTFRGEGEPLGFSTGLCRRLLDTRVIHPSGTRVLGWDTPSPGLSSAGRLFGRNTVGHLGFTGTSLWIDLERGNVVSLLTNRVCPSRKSILIRAFRPQAHDVAWAWAQGIE